ncbi:AAA family ATPase [Paraburkholderia bannensis]|uniref:AAA family ATPase n=1 Tax=Paraburkholderia bannensis TaxID=765414 RepID=UPI002AB7EC5D|nr:AAA family ATPase [Paraburkholderia bannensis]
MRLHKIEIGEHRIIRNARVDLTGKISHPALKNVYGELAITLVAGRNGSGKSSLLSFVAQVFHHLERSPHKIPGRFSIEYSLARSERATVRCRLYRRYAHEAVRLEVVGQFDRAITNRVLDKAGIRDDEVLYADIREFLPANVIVSAFSLSGEYPTERVSNFGGDRRLKVFDVSKLYGFNHFAFPSLSPALALLMQRWQNDRGAVNALEVALGATITGEVLIRKRDETDQDPEEQWVMFTSAIQKREAEGSIYINDIAMASALDRRLTLQTMSSGQKFLLVRIVSILGAIQHNSMVIVEEPELHLDPTWSRQIISLLVSFFKDYKAHLLLATHAFSLLNAVPSDWVVVAEGGQFGPARENTLLANESSLAGLLYGADSHVVEDRIRQYIHRASADQLMSLFQILGESSTRYDVFRKIKAKVARDA